jgi:hypothetical protein
MRRHARLHEEAPGSRQSPRRGLAVNSWVGGKGRPPREMETAPREWSRLPLRLARHSSAFRRYRSASSIVMPYHARRADPFLAMSATLMTLPP